MTVCLHCGEMAGDGALFCTKCGYTLPQVDVSAQVAPNATGGTPSPAGVPTVVPLPAAPPRPAPSSPLGVPWAYPPVAYATLAPPVPSGAVGPIMPPPAGKYCIRCRAVISRVAVYCPVCQQPQA